MIMQSTKIERNFVPLTRNNSSNHTYHKYSLHEPLKIKNKYRERSLLKHAWIYKLNNRFDINQ